MELELNLVCESIELRIKKMAGEMMAVEKHNTYLGTGISEVLMELGNFPVAIGGQDLPLRRRVDDVVRQARRRLADKFDRLADEAGEPKE